MTNHDKLRELAQAATPGPWWTDATCDVYAGRGSCEDLAVAYGVFGGRPRDAEFIAAANPTAILALLDGLQAAKADAWEEGVRIATDHATLKQIGVSVDNLHNPYGKDNK